MADFLFYAQPGSGPGISTWKQLDTNLNVQRVSVVNQTASGVNGSDIADSFPFQVVQGASASIVGLTVDRFENASTTVHTVKSASGRLWWVHGFSLATVSVFIQLYDESGSITVGTTVPILTLEIPPGDGASIYGIYADAWSPPVQFGNSIKYAVTQGPLSSNSTAPGAVVLVNVGYK